MRSRRRPYSLYVLFSLFSSDHKLIAVLELKDRRFVPYHPEAHYETRSSSLNNGPCVDKHAKPETEKKWNYFSAGTTSESYNGVALLFPFHSLGRLLGHFTFVACYHPDPEARGWFYRWFYIFHGEGECSSRSNPTRVLHSLFNKQTFLSTRLGMQY
jgi:hypothetical protein